jgi:hypothetical protein
MGTLARSDINNKFDAFISYFEETGASNAETVKRNLESRDINIRTFVAHLERPNYAGDFEKKIDEVIACCKYFILLINVDTLNRPQVIREMKKAFPNGLSNNPKLTVFHQNQYNIPRSTDNFIRQTNIDIGKANQQDFKDNSELASRVLTLFKHGLDGSLKIKEVGDVINQKELQDISYKEIILHLNRINSGNGKVRQSAWNRLEKLAQDKTIWKHDETWKALDQQLLSDIPNLFFRNALMLLKWMLLNRKRESGNDENDVSIKVKNRYREKIINVLQSSDVIWTDHKSDCKQILGYIASSRERFSVYWKAWKKTAVEIIDDNRYTNEIGHFINEMISAKAEDKKEIEEELFGMIENPDSRIADRASDLYHELFER